MSEANISPFVKDIFPEWVRTDRVHDCEGSGWGSYLEENLEVQMPQDPLQAGYGGSGKRHCRTVR